MTKALLARGGPEPRGYFLFHHRLYYNMYGYIYVHWAPLVSMVRLPEALLNTAAHLRAFSLVRWLCIKTLAERAPHTQIVSFQPEELVYFVVCV